MLRLATHRCSPDRIHMNFFSLKGKTCSVRVEAIDRCPEGACSNGGTCMREAGGWHCACTSGWGGVTCGAPLPPAACPCAAGGTCVPAGGGAGGWECACRAGRGGARCELVLDPCASAPCRNGGRCSRALSGEWWACECAPGWAGDACSEPACEPACAAPASCRANALRPAAPPRCLCPAAPHRTARRCLECELVTNIWYTLVSNTY